MEDGKPGMATRYLARRTTVDMYKSWEASTSTPLTREHLYFSLWPLLSQQSAISTSASKSTIVLTKQYSGHLTSTISRYKAWKLIGMHSFCALCFTAGYALREYGAFDHYYYSNKNLTVFILSQVLIYICPLVLPPNKHSGC